MTSKSPPVVGTPRAVRSARRITLPRAACGMTDESRHDAAAAGAVADADPGEDPDDDTLAPGLSDDGILLFFAGLASLLAATTAASTGEPQPVTVFAVLAGLPALAAFAADLVSDFVPGTGLELLVGGSALAGGLFAVPGRHYVNIATLFVAAALVLWRVVDVEFRDAER